MKKLIFSLFLGLAACNTTPASVADNATATGTPAAISQTTQTANAAKAGVPAAAADKTTHSEYMVQPGDMLTIMVWKEKDLQGDFMVRPDGGLNFPLAGEVSVSGKTLEQVQKDLSAKLAKYVPDPAVTVVVKQSLGNKIYVVGRVNKPGEYASNRTMDVMQALSMAGGLTPFASVNKIKILRRDANGNQKAIPFKYSRVEKGEDLGQNIILQGGDVVVVP